MIEAADPRDDDPLPGWTVKSERLLRDQHAIELVWSTPEGDVVIVWPLASCEA